MITTYDSSLAQLAFQSAALTNGAHQGAAVDTAVFNNRFRDVVFTLTTGVVTDGTHAVTVEESNASGSGFAAAANVLGTLPSIASSDSNKVFEIGVVPTKRYVRVIVTTSGATTGAVISGAARLGNGSFGPVARS